MHIVLQEVGSRMNTYSDSSFDSEVKACVGDVDFGIEVLNVATHVFVYDGVHAGVGEFSRRASQLETQRLVVI